MGQASLITAALGYPYRYHGRFSWWTLIGGLVVLVVAGIAYLVLNRQRKARSEASRRQMDSELAMKAAGQLCRSCGQVNPAMEAMCVSCGHPLAGPVTAGVGLGGQGAAPPPPGAGAKKVGIVSHDIEIDGQVAFGQGEVVDIESVDPDPGNPDNKYVVLSKNLGKRYRLSDKDLMA